MDETRILRYIEILSAIAICAAWITIALSILLNPWFRVTANALSDLGGGNPQLNGHPSPTDPWVYNYGLMITGLLIALMASCSIWLADRKAEITGMSFFIISGLFLALIGIYHEGTYPHDFVSIWFFIIASISYLAVGISLIMKEPRFGIPMVLFLLLSWVAYLTVHWQSTAEDEIFGIVVIDILVIIYVISVRSRVKGMSHHNRRAIQKS